MPFSQRDACAFPKTRACMPPLAAPPMSPSLMADVTTQFNLLLLFQETLQNVLGVETTVSSQLCHLMTCDVGAAASIFLHPDPSAGDLP